MNKQEFLDRLRDGLSVLPQKDAEEHLAFYSEMIDDRIEEGLLEDDAVGEIGSVDSIVSQIVADVPTAKNTARQKKKMKSWEIILLVLGSPIWLSLVIAAFSVLLSIYVVLWSAIISLWAVFGALIGCTVACIAAGIVFIPQGNTLSGIATIGAGTVCAGISIFMYFGCKAATKGILLLTKKLALWIKNCLVKKEEQ